MTRIRRAELADIPKLVELGRVFYAEHPFAAHAPYDDESITVMLTTVLSDRNGAIFVAETNDEIVGGVVVLITPLFVNTKLHVANEIAWFVRIDRRISGVGLRLKSAVEAWANEQSADFIVFSSINGGTDVAKLYERDGATAYETSYIKRLP